MSMCPAYTVMNLLIIVCPLPARVRGGAAQRLGRSARQFQRPLERAFGSSAPAFLCGRHAGEPVDPTERGPAPALPLRLEGRALGDRPDPQRVNLRVVDRTGIDRRAAIPAEGVAAFVAAFGRLHIAFRRTAEHKM